MKKLRLWSKLLLWAHLFVCLVWLYLYRNAYDPLPDWVLHIYILSILGIQFTWGVTVGLIVGPSRKRRPLLWWSLLLIFMPLSVIGPLIREIAIELGPFLALIYLAVFVLILACETFGGVLLGAKVHSQSVNK
ncbi:MAG TPA: hypothetical protein VFB38_23675 [Chthonomonadaceae bacterium]|nr:hypothetical protein [Chthonomonadaceae bacterium]